MVAGLTHPREDYSKVKNEMKTVGIRAQELKANLLTSVERDTEAFNKIIEGMRMPKKTPEQKETRKKAIMEATKIATLVPLDVLEKSYECTGISRIVAEKGFKSSLSDAGVAAACAMAAAEGAFLNVAINLLEIEDASFVCEIRGKALDVRNKTAATVKEIEKFIHKELKV